MNYQDSTVPKQVWLAANNGAMGGGEVMLLRFAQAARSVGADVGVVGMGNPAELIEQTRANSFPSVGLDPGTLAASAGLSSSRASYATALRRWDRRRIGVLWCQGLVPGVATAGHRRRIIHLHQLPQNRAQWAAARLAMAGAARVLVPSFAMQAQIPNAQVLPNWSPAPPLVVRPAVSRPLRVGYLGRLSQAKGVDVLAEAMALVRRELGADVELALAGDSRFVPTAEQRAVTESLQKLGNGVRIYSWLEPGELFAGIDVLAVPSRGFESFGLVAVEAMAARVPVVVSDAGALPEVVGLEHPWVAEAGNSERLAQHLVAALQEPAAHVVEQAHQRWFDKYSPQAGQDAVAALVDEFGGP